nr:signal peptidase I [Sanguibacter hominis]
MRFCAQVLLTAAAALGVASALLFVGTKAGVVATYYVTSGSMEPSFGAGDLLISRPISAADLAVGDVVTVQASDGYLVTHRVQEIADGADASSRAVILKGDANATPDPTPYLVDDVWQVAVAVPGGATFFAFLTTGLTPVFMIAAIIGVAGSLLMGPGPSRSPRRVAERAETELEPRPLVMWLPEPVAEPVP